MSSKIRPGGLALYLVFLGICFVLSVEVTMLATDRPQRPVSAPATGATTPEAVERSGSAPEPSPSPPAAKQATATAAGDVIWTQRKPARRNASAAASAEDDPATPPATEEPPPATDPPAEPEPQQPQNGTEACDGSPQQPHFCPQPEAEPAPAPQDPDGSEDPS